MPESFEGFWAAVSAVGGLLAGLAAVGTLIANLCAPKRTHDRIDRLATRDQNPDA
jgi:hypothetical protein